MKVRVLMVDYGIDRQPKRSGVALLRLEARRRGIEDRFEARYVTFGMHTKAFTVDDRLVLAGSMNFHFSSWGSLGLNEAMLATSDAGAVAQQRASFEDVWAHHSRAIEQEWWIGGCETWSHDLNSRSWAGTEPAGMLNPAPGGRRQVKLSPWDTASMISSRWGAALLVSIWLGDATAQTSLDIPALPLPSAPPSSSTTAPVPVPAPAPAPSPVPAPAPEPTAAPTPPTRPARTAPLLITVQAQWPALVDGKKTTVPFSRTLTLPGPRVAELRSRRVITASLEADLREFLADLPREPQNARFENLWDGWAVVQRGSLTVDETKTRANVLAALKDPRGVKANVVVTGQTAPKRTLDYFLSRGITAHLGTGETNYYGSSPERVTNIHVGASRFQDRLLEGKTFSFNQMVGPINMRTGFVTGLVIAGDRTANGVGGGICQVSTTVFRTLYSAGLPILERRNHSYQVRYYDPQGLDGTIYQPNLDLTFANDTGGALWFQSEWNDEETRLTVSVFGRARDFTVEVGTPQTLKSTPAPPDRLIRDATLPAGARKQVDWAAPGAVMEVTRRFVREGQTFKQDTLKSTYRPWPNIFLVGTRR
ncbi:VanW family protein [Deinococcus aetherius]|uniref:VanW family protein n=1 Tax=Deinococcus aetherius TaxID=200252 RepID=UPI0031F14884